MPFGSNLELAASLAVAVSALRAGIEVVHRCKFDIWFKKGGLRRDVCDGFANTTIDDNLLSIGLHATNGDGLGSIFREHFASRFDSFDECPAHTYQGYSWGKGWGIWCTLDNSAN